MLPSSARTAERRWLPLLFAPLLLLAACGGSDPTDPQDPQDPGGSSGVVGTILHGGAGVGGVQVILRDGPGADRQVTTGNDGAFAFANAEVGSWQIEFTPPAYFQMAPGQAAVRTVQVTATGATTVPVTLAPVASLPVQEIGALATSFTPGEVTVPPGTRIRWTSQSTDAHTVTPTQHQEWDEGALGSSGAVFEAVMNNPGTFNYRCVPHLSLGMTGTITVTP